MFVYGIRCSASVVIRLPNTADADYYMEHDLLIFPTYSYPTCIRNYGLKLTKRFLRDFKRIAERPNEVHVFDFEDPFLEEEEAALIRVVCAEMPGSSPSWYYIP